MNLFEEAVLAFVLVGLASAVGLILEWLYLLSCGDAFDGDE